MTNKILSKKDFEELHERYHKGELTREQIIEKWRQDDLRLSSGLTADCKYCR